MNVVLRRETTDILKHIPLILFFFALICWIVLAYKIGGWRNWRLYYPTILFFWCGDLIYNVLFYNKPLWKFENHVFSHQLTDLICIFVVFTCTILIYLYHFPKTLRKQVLYVAFWVALYSTIEWLFHIQGGITYHNNWGIKMSIIHNIYQFLLLKIHHHNPILAWSLALLILVIIGAIFDIDITSSKEILDNILGI